VKRIAPVLVALLAGCARELVCPTGEVDCGGTCVSLLSDRHHCGACGVACGPLEVCSAGDRTCAPGIDVCGGQCIDLARDPDHCGTCATACAPEELCHSTSGCVASCPAGTTACNRACVALDSDPFHCGACGNICSPGERCRSGQCRADLYVACMATNEVVPVTADLALAGGSLVTPGAPSDVAFLDAAVVAASAVFPSSAYVTIFPVDPTRSTRTVSISSNDLSRFQVHGNMLLLSNAAAGTLIVLDSSGNVLDEIPLPGQQSGPNPHGVAVLGNTAWVALYGNDPSSGQTIAKVDLSTIGGGASLGKIGLLQVPGAYDPPGLPLPDSVAVDGERVYVTLKNWADDPNDTFTFYAMPAGSGRLAIITPAAGDDVTIVDLGTSCGSPGDIVLHGTTLWITCGGFSYPELARRRLLPVDISTGIPLLGPPIDLGDFVPAKLAFCGGMGYVGDQMTGAVIRFDPVARAAEAPVNVCPPGLFFTSVTDIACPP
jgi:Stigma-specific protein, Stig1